LSSGGVGGGDCQSAGMCSGSMGSLTQVHQGLVLGWLPLNSLRVRRMLLRHLRSAISRRRAWLMRRCSALTGR
jgi:hypothetical protein